jgi:hypothetical protein
MKTNKELNEILNECLDRLNRGETVAQCLARFPQNAVALEQLLDTASLAHKISAVRPRPAFKAIAKAQFLAVVREAEVKKARRVAWLPGWVAAAASALVVILAGGGTAIAAGNSMPDSPLYSVKLATEQVRLTLTFSGEGKTELYAQFADNRVTEIAYMADKGDAGKIGLLTSRLDTNLVKLAGSEVVQESSGGTGWLKFGASTGSNAEDLETTTTVTAGLEATPEPDAATTDELMQPMAAPPPVLEAPAAAGDRTTQMYSDDGAAHSEQWSAIERQYADNIALLQAALAKAPEELKPALQHALDVLIAGYNNALIALH